MGLNLPRYLNCGEKNLIFTNLSNSISKMILKNLNSLVNLALFWQAFRDTAMRLLVIKHVLKTWQDWVLSSCSLLLSG